MQFKPGDKVRVIIGLGNRLKLNSIYTISKATTGYIYIEGECGGWLPERFELVKPVNSVSFKVLEWSDWVKGIVDRLKIELKYDISDDPIAEVTVEDLLFSSKLDPENIQLFCREHMFSNLYENHIFVKHHRDKDCYWYINSEDTTLIYKPKLA